MGDGPLDISLDRHLEIARRESIPLARLEGILRLEAVRRALRWRAIIDDSPEEMQALARRIFSDEVARAEAIRIMNGLPQERLPPPSGLNARDPWVARALERGGGEAQPAAGHTRIVPWTDRLETYARGRHAASDEEIVLLRMILDDYLGRIEDPFSRVDSELLETIARHRTRKGHGMHYHRLCTILKDFAQLMGWGDTGLVLPTAGSEGAVRLTPEGIANLALGRYLASYRQLVPDQDPHDSILCLDALLRRILQDLLLQSKTIFDEEALFESVRDLIDGLNRREHRLQKPPAGDGWSLPDGAAWTLGAMGQSPVARLVLMRLRDLLLSKDTISGSNIEAAVTRVIEDRRRWMGEVWTADEAALIRAKFQDRLPIIHSYVRAARRLVGREPDPQSRRIMTVLMVHYLFGGGVVRYNELIGPVLRADDNGLGDRVIELSGQATRRRIDQAQAVAAREVGEILDYINLIPEAMATGLVTIEDGSDAKGSLKRWGDDFLPWLQRDSSWDEVMGESILRLGLAGNDTQIERLLSASDAVEREIARLIDARKTPPPAQVDSEPPPTLRTVTLPARTWVTDHYAHLSSAEHGPFWRRVKDLATRSAPAFMVFYLTEEGVRVSRVGRGDWEKAQNAVRGSSHNVFPGVFQFTDLETETTVDLLPTQVRLVAEIDAKVRDFIDWVKALPVDDPSFSDFQLLESLSFFLPLGDRSNQDYQALVRSLMAEPTRTNLRWRLNEYMTRHETTIGRCRNFYANMGPWHISEGVRRSISEIALKDPILFGRFEKVVDLVETESGLPAEWTTPLREAVRLDVHRLHRDLPDGDEFLPLAVAPELVYANSVDLMVVRAQVVKDMERAVEGDDSWDRLLRSFYRNAVKILDDPKSELMRRVLRVLLECGVNVSYIARRMVHLVNAMGGDRDAPKKRQKRMEEVLRFYLEHRSEFLWRARERAGVDGFQWLAFSTPEDMPGRHASSTQFSEFEEISFGEIDSYRDYLFQVLKVAPEAFAVDLEDNGLWRRVIIPTEQIIFRDARMGGQAAKVPIGIQSGGQKLYFETLMRTPRWERMVGRIPDGVRALRVIDATGNEVVLQGEKISGEVTHIANLRENREALELKAFEFLVLAEDQLRDLHPLIVMIFNSVVDEKPADPTPYKRLYEMAKTHLKRPELMRSNPGMVRNALIDIYTMIRPQLPGSGIRGRFAKHFDNPIPSR